MRGRSSGAYTVVSLDSSLSGTSVTSQRVPIHYLQFEKQCHDVYFFTLHI